MDPLSVLRDFTIRDSLSQIVRVDTHFRFSNSFSFPCTIETNYRSNHGNLYTLETLVFFVTNLRLNHHDYIRYAAAHNIPTVTFLDRKDLIDYLHGNIASTHAIEFVDRDNEFNLVNILDKIAKDPVLTVGDVNRLLRNRDLLSECAIKDFYSVYRGLVEGTDERERNESKKVEVEGSSRVGEGVPIILVPHASQVLINLYNVKEFLEDGVYVPNDVKFKEFEAEGVKPDCVTVQKKFGRDRVVRAYEVRDRVSGLKPEDWDRVVAAFVLGKEWQFKDWPFKDCVEIFDKILGFYMRFDDDSLDSAKTVKQWNVKIISIGRNKRHQDRAAALDVWERLEEFMRSRSIS